MKKVYLVILSLFILLMISTTVQSVTVGPGTFFYPSAGSTNYTFSRTFVFKVITITPTTLKLNATVFNTTSPVKMNMSFSKFTDNRTYAMTTNISSPARILMNITGLPIGACYVFYANEIAQHTNFTDTNGNASFYYYHTAGEHRLLIRACTTQVRIRADRTLVNVMDITSTVMTILGVAMIIAAILIIIYVMRSQI